MKHILILGVGNILFTDEGIGVRALEWLQEHYAFPENVTLVDGGTLGMGLMDALLKCDYVYVLTPRGQIIDLVTGATPLDFAYRLHSEIGDHVVGVKINGKMSNLNKKLEQGDIVEILTSKNQTPKSSWLSKIFTSHARQKLLRTLNVAAKNKAPTKIPPAKKK